MNRLKNMEILKKSLVEFLIKNYIVKLVCTPVIEGR